MGNRAKNDSRNKIILLGGLYTNSVILFNIQNNE